MIYIVLYARADVSYVCVPKESGGCGEPHRRPVIHGAPSPVFKLECQGCENYLRADIARAGNKRVRTVNSDHGMKLEERYLGLWGASPDTIPESPDEEKRREFMTQKTVTQNASTQTEAFGRIADALAGNTELIAKLAEMVAGQHAFGPGSPILPVPVDTDEPAPEPRQWQYPFGSVPAAEAHACLDCGVAIVRKEGQRGALPQRCVACKTKRTANRRKAA